MPSQRKHQGSGNLGPSVVAALLDAGFGVTVLTRADSGASFPSPVRVHKTDYESPSALALALAGQDAVVSTIGSPGLAQQAGLIDAAVTAGVRRFIPSEFGVNTQKARGGLRQILRAKLDVQAKLTEAVEANAGFSWTGISTNPFFDWVRPPDRPRLGRAAADDLQGLKSGFLGYSVKEQTARILDSGDEPFTASNLAFIGRAVAAVLTSAHVANRYIEVASFFTTQNEILRILEEETAATWTVVKKSTADCLQRADEKLAQGDLSSFGDYLQATLWADGKGSSPKPEELQNQALGLPLEDLRATIKSIL